MFQEEIFKTNSADMSHSGAKAPKGLFAENTDSGHIIADEELDLALLPRLFEADTKSPPISPLKTKAKASRAKKVSSKTIAKKKTAQKKSPKKVVQKSKAKPAVEPKARPRVAPKKVTRSARRPQKQPEENRSKLTRTEAEMTEMRQMLKSNMEKVVHENGKAMVVHAPKSEERSIIIKTAASVQDIVKALKQSGIRARLELDIEDIS